jgi:hypothetical protein
MTDWHHGGLYAPRSCVQIGDRRRWTSIRGSFRFSRGAYAPRSCHAVRMSAGEKRFFSMHKRTPKKSGGREPAVGSQTASATAMRGISVVRFAFREHTTGG